MIELLCSACFSFAVGMALGAWSMYCKRVDTCRKVGIEALQHICQGIEATKRSAYALESAAYTIDLNQRPPINFPKLPALACLEPRWFHTQVTASYHPPTEAEARVINDHFGITCASPEHTERDCSVKGRKRIVLNLPGHQL